MKFQNLRTNLLDNIWRRENIYLLCLRRQKISKLRSLERFQTVSFSNKLVIKTYYSDAYTAQCDRPPKKDQIFGRDSVRIELLR